MPLWTYTKKPDWPPLIPEDIVKSDNTGWIRKDTGEILVVIDGFDKKHDIDVSNLELEDGNDFLLENDSEGQAFILLE